MSSRTRQKPVVAIDGPAGVGKSTTARALAVKLGYVLVDTGALYRGVALAASERQIAWDDADALAELAARLRLEFQTAPDGTPRLHIDGSDRADDIRSPDIAQGASQVSAHPGVRTALLDVQRALGRDGGVVLEGRDIGTVVFPDAEVKVFLTASPDERARRRVGDLAARGIAAEVDDIRAKIEARDRADSTRPVAPLKAADDAVLLDSTALDAEAVLAKLEGLVHAWFRAQNKT